MLGAIPHTLDDTSQRRAGWIHAAVGLCLLIVSMASAVAIEDGDRGYWIATTVFAVFALCWIPLIIPLFPRRTSRPLLTLGFYIVLLALGTVLVTRSEIFSIFASIGYPYAFALFSSRWSALAVAATAILPLLAKNGFTAAVDAPIWVLLLSVAGPLVYTGWMVGFESDKRRRANAELVETNNKLENALAENAGLHAQLVSQAREAGVVDERARLAQEIHDTVAQGLTGIITQLQAATPVTSNAQPVQHHLDKIDELARGSLREARRFVQAMHPESLADSRLPDALSELAHEWSKTTGIPVITNVTGQEKPLLADIEVTLFRVVQEALSNAEKHAKAERIGVTLSYLDDIALLDVRDDGIGFEPDATSRNVRDGTGFGLGSMRQRVQRVAGVLEIESSIGEGTAISVQVPAIPAE